MEWHGWLSKSGLEPGLVYEYSLIFSKNELEKDDINHFNHEFLQSMGISVAKHRLEILKLARKEMTKRSISRLLAAIHRTKKSIAKYISSILRRDSSSIVIVPTRASYYGMQQPKKAMLKRSKKQMQIKQRRLLLTDGPFEKSPAVHYATRNTSPMIYKEKKVGGHCNGNGNGHRGSGSEDIRWDSMFQDLNPT